MPDKPIAPVGDTRELPVSLPPLAALAWYLTRDVEVTKQADTDGLIRNLEELIHEFPDAVHDRVREAGEQRRERLAWAAGAGSDGSWERQPIGRAGDPDVIGAGMKQLTAWGRAGKVETTGVRNGIVETMTDADWARLALVQIQASDGARTTVDVRRVGGGDSEWSDVHFVRDSLLELCPPLEAPPAPEPAAPQTHAECVTCLQAIADASPGYRSHTRKELAAICMGKLTHKEWRHALDVAFQDRAVWKALGARKRL